MPARMPESRLSVSDTTGVLVQARQNATGHQVTLRVPCTAEWSCANKSLSFRFCSGLRERPVQLRTEIREKELLHIIQFASPAEVSLPGVDERLRGVLLDTDSIRPIGEGESWREVESNLDLVHAASKELFFELLTAETLERLEPEYQEQQP